MHHLKVTGELDDQTKKKMDSPRCGFHDLPLVNRNSKIAEFKTRNILNFFRVSLKLNWNSYFYGIKLENGVTQN